MKSIIFCEDFAKQILICRQFKSTLLLNLSRIAITWESSNSYCTIRNIPFNFWVGVLLNRFSFFSDCLCACVFFPYLRTLVTSKAKAKFSFFCPAPMHSLVRFFLSVRFWAYFLIHILKHQQLIHVLNSRKVDSLSGQFPFCFILMRTWIQRTWINAKQQTRMLSISNDHL